jgi:two-component system, chemotaxis family, protein-glutamate methylesterase/glutaminase
MSHRPRLYREFFTTEVSEVVESQLWQCMRGLEEMDMLFKNIAEQYDELKQPKAAKLFRAKSQESGKRARIIHDEVFQQNQYSEDIRLNKYKKGK